MDLRCYTNDEVAKRSESIATRFDIREVYGALGMKLVTQSIPQMRMLTFASRTSNKHDIA